MPNDPWIAVLEREAADLELKASWASQVGYGRVRDHIRHAIAELREEIERRKKLAAAPAGADSR